MNRTDTPQPEQSGVSWTENSNRILELERENAALRDALWQAAQDLRRHGGTVSVRDAEEVLNMVAGYPEKARVALKGAA